MEEQEDQQQMQQQLLREKLEQLHVELERTEAVDDKTRERLTDLSKDIRDLLDRPDEGADQRYGSLNTRLQSNLAHFEASHPRLTAAMQHAVDALVQMGV